MFFTRLLEIFRSNHIAPLDVRSERVSAILADGQIAVRNRRAVHYVGSGATAEGMPCRVVWVELEASRANLKAFIMTYMMIYYYI